MDLRIASNWIPNTPSRDPHPFEMSKRRAYILAACLKRGIDEFGVELALGINLEMVKFNIPQDHLQTAISLIESNKLSQEEIRALSDEHGYYEILTSSLRAAPAVQAVETKTESIPPVNAEPDVVRVAEGDTNVTRTNDSENDHGDRPGSDPGVVAANDEQERSVAVQADGDGEVPSGPTAGKESRKDPGSKSSRKKPSKSQQ